MEPLVIDRAVNTSAYGMLITLNDDFKNQLKEYLRDSDAVNKHDIGVQYGGTTKTFSFSEFLEQLGFEESENA
jgi:hypothetical protein